MHFSEGFKDQVWGKESSFHTGKIIWSKKKTKKTNPKQPNNQQTTTTFVAIELCHSCCGRHGLSGGNMQG